MRSCWVSRVRSGRPLLTAGLAAAAVLVSACAGPGEASEPDPGADAVATTASPVVTPVPTTSTSTSEERTTIVVGSRPDEPTTTEDDESDRTSTTATDDGSCDGELASDPELVDGYRRMDLCGWQVFMSADLFGDDLAPVVHRDLAEDLGMVEAALPAEAVEFLRATPIWMELDVTAFPGGVYHPSAEWLADNGYPTKWARSIQFGVARNYLTWTAQQPAMLLHELTHAWHDQRYGYDQPDVVAAYEQAMADGRYDAVEYVTGGTEPAYATTNAIEYLAELSEAYFWSNDFFPFDRQDLADHDPDGLAVVELIWQVDPS